jgi:glycosyltransferase involved in cell wall biosynthesis
LKILVIAPDVFFETKNSAAVHLHEIISNLKRKADVYTIARGTKNIKQKENVYLVKKILNLRLFSTPTTSINAFISGLRILIKHDIDEIYERHHIFDTGIILAKLFNIPYISEVNGIPTKEAEVSGSYGKSIQKIVRIIEKIILKRADKIVAVSHSIKRIMETEYDIESKNITVIQNGANTDLFKPMDTKEVRKELNFNRNANYVGFSGSFASWHGLEDLVKSAPLILKEVVSTKFLLVGAGKRKEQIVQMVNDLNLTDNFIFINKISYEEVPKYVNAFDVCVILKKKDIPGSPLKLWEYMACGKPVIATNTEDFKALEEYNAGILVDPEKPEEVADAIITLLENRELREEMGKNGRKYVVENRSWESVAREVEKVMREAVKYE